EVARATLMIYCAPFFVAALAHWLVPNDRLTPARSIGLVAAFAGVVAAFGDRVAAPDAAGLVGDLLCMLGAFFWGATTIVIKTTRLRGALPEKNLLYQLGVSAVMLVAASMLVGEPGLFAPSPLVWTALAYTTIVVAGSSYLAWFSLVSRYRATTLHAFTFLTPVAGVFFAHLLLGEPITPGLGIGIVLIAADIVLVNREPKGKAGKRGAAAAANAGGAGRGVRASGAAHAGGLHEGDGDERHDEREHGHHDEELAQLVVVGRHLEHACLRLAHLAADDVDAF